MYLFAYIERQRERERERESTPQLQCILRHTAEYRGLAFGSLVWHAYCAGLLSEVSDGRLGGGPSKMLAFRLLRVPAAP